MYVMERLLSLFFIDLIYFVLVFFFTVGEERRVKREGVGVGLYIRGGGKLLLYLIYMRTR
jgi:hypothetical protein